MSFVAFGRQTAKNQTIRNAHKLYQQNGQHQLCGAKTQLGPVNHRHRNNDANPIIVNKKGNQIFKKFLILPDVAQSFTDLLETHTHQANAGGHLLANAHRLWYLAEDGNGEHNPPDGHTEQ